jgi:hypothetical protein
VIEEGDAGMPEARSWSEECALFYDGKGGAALRGIDGELVASLFASHESRQRGTKSSAEEKKLPRMTL